MKRLTSSAPGFSPEPEDVDFDDVSGVVADKDDEEAEIAAEFDADPNKAEYIVKIYRVPPNGGKNVWLFNCKPSDLPVMERIRDEFGSGNYVARVYLNSRLKRTIKYSIEAPQKIVAPSNDPMIAAMREQTRLLESLINRAPASPSGMQMSDLAAIIGAVTPIITALISRPAPAGGGLQDMLGLLATAKELVGGGAPDEPDSLLGLGARLLSSPGIIEALTKQAPPRQAQVIQQQPPALTAPQAPSPEQIQQAQLAQLQQILTYLVGKAKNNRPIDLYADWLEEELPPQYLAMIKLPGAIDYLIQVQPAVGVHRVWFEALLYALTEGVNDPDGGEVGGPAPRSETGNVSEPSASALSAHGLAHGLGGGPFHAGAYGPADEMG